MDQNWMRTLVPHWLHHRLLWGMLHASTSSTVRGVAVGVERPDGAWRQ